MSEPARKIDHFDSLAILGALPKFEKPLHVGLPNIGNIAKLQKYFSDILNRRWLTNNGPVVQEFEEKVQKTLNVNHCIAVCNATKGLELVIRALELEGEIIVPSFTFPASAQAIAWCGVKPVFCDVDPDFHTTNPESVKKLIGKRTSGILGVHLWGNPCAIDELEALASAENISLFFDSAHAFGCSHKKKMIGNFGSAEVFSFHATKVVNAFEGGAITTNDDVLAEKLRLLINFGFDSGRVKSLGTNAKLSEIHAAMGLVSMDSMSDFFRNNQKNRVAYEQGLANIRGITLNPLLEGGKHNFQYVVVSVDEEKFGLTRDELLMVLRKENILARDYFNPGCHQIAPFASVQSRAPLPVTEKLVESVLVLPTGTGVSSEDISIISNVIAQAAELSKEIKNKIESM